LKKPAYKTGEKINWYTGGEGSIQDEGIIAFSNKWKNSYTYLIKDRIPHLWIAEEMIVGYKERRTLRDKLDNLSGQVTRSK